MSVRGEGFDLEFEDIDGWPGSKKEPYARLRDEPMGLMSYGELSDERRPFIHLRRNVLAGTSGLQTRFQHDGPPMANWSNHYHTPESWENVKDLHEGDRYVVNMTHKAQKHMKPDFRQHLQEDDSNVVVNPIEMINLFKDKYKTAKHLEDEGLPSVPTLRGDEILDEGLDYVESQLGDGGEHGFVAKPYNGSSGDGIETFNSLDGVNEYLDGGIEDGDETYDPGEYVVQPKIPHESDLRVITAGEEIVNAERRYSPQDDIRTNLSQIDGEINGTDFKIYGKALKAFEQGRVEAINVNVDNEIPEDVYDAFSKKNSTMLGTGARDLANDIVNSFDPDEFGYNGDLDRKPFKIGMDLIETTKEDIQHLPEHVQERAIEYADGDTVYLSPELNGSPGSMADLVARWSGLDNQVSALHVNKLMRDLAGLETDPVTDHVYNQESEIWQNVEDWYPERDEDYLSKGHYNLRPRNK